MSSVLESSKPASGGLSVLKTRPEFLYVRGGEKAGRPSILIECRASDKAADGIRFGLTATKKLGNAVVRNRAKRRMREAARHLLPLYGQIGHDYVLVARSGIIAAEWTQLLDDIKAALIRLRGKKLDTPHHDSQHP